MPTGMQLESWKSGVYCGYQYGRKTGFKQGETLGYQAGYVQGYAEGCKKSYEAHVRRNSGSETPVFKRRTRKFQTDKSHSPFQRRQNTLKTQKQTEFPQELKEHIRLQILHSKNRPSNHSLKHTTKIMEFNWHKKQPTHTPKRVHTSHIVLAKIQKKTLQQIKKRANMSSKLVNKTIASIYNIAYVKFKQDPELGVLQIAFDEFTHRYGLKKVAERKFTEFLGSVLYINSPRSVSFIRMISLGQKIKQKNLSPESSQFIIQAYHYLLNAKIGISLHLDESADYILIPTIRVIQFVKEKAEKFIEKSEYSKLITRIEKQSVADPKRINHGGLIEFDLSMKILTDSFERYENNIKQGVELVFKTFFKEEISQKEFQIFAKMVCPEKLTQLEGNQDQKYNQVELYKKCVGRNMFSVLDLRKWVGQNLVKEEELEEKKIQIEGIVQACSENYYVKWKTWPIEEYTSFMQRVFEGQVEIEPEVACLSLNLLYNEVKRIEQFLN